MPSGCEPSDPRDLRVDDADIFRTGPLGSCAGEEGAEGGGERSASGLLAALLWLLGGSRMVSRFMVSSGCATAIWTSRSVAYGRVARRERTSVGTIQGAAGQVDFELGFDGKPHGSFNVILQIELRKKRDKR